MSTGRAPPASSPAARTRRERSRGLASSWGRWKSRRAARMAVSKSACERSTRGAGAAPGESPPAPSGRSSASLHSIQVWGGVDPPVVDEHPVAVPADREVGLRGTGEANGLEEGAPALRLGHGGEAPGQAGVLAHGGHHGHHVMRRRVLVAFPPDEEAVVQQALAGAQRAVRLHEAPGASRAGSAAASRAVTLSRSRATVNPTIWRAPSRKTTKSCGRRASSSGRRAPTAPPHGERTMSTSAGRPSAGATSAEAWPNEAQS